MQRFCTLVLFASTTTAAMAGLSDGAPGEAAYVKRTGGQLLLGNRCIELAFRTADNRCTICRLVNKLADRTLPVESDDFSLGIEDRKPLSSADFVFKEARDEAIPGGRQLTLHLESDTLGIGLDVVYELGDEDFFVRRRLVATVKKPLPLREVDVWLVKLPGECSHQGRGEPVFLEDTFWGLESPAAWNHFKQGMVSLRQHPGRTIDERFAGKSAVLGVAEPGRVAKRFLGYVETFRVTPKQTALFVNYNTYWTVDPPNEKQLLELIALFKRKLFDPYGESFDTFTIDNRWDNKQTLWSIHTERFPRGFTPLVESLKTMNAQLGLWLSPSSGYGTAKWGVTAGYAGNADAGYRGYLCQAGEKYRRDIVKVCTDLGRKYNLAFWKFDGFSAGCPGPGLLPGPYTMEANVDAFIELLTEVRKVRRDVYLDPTCGMWLSPWWLKHADSIWGSVSADYPDPVVPAPNVRDSATSTRDEMFRRRCRQHPGYPTAAIEHLGIVVISPEKWTDNAMIVMGRGCRLLTLYINPKHFLDEDRDWAFLASILKWARHNAATLQNTELILGDPFERKAYGYAHFHGSRGILAMRNPFIEPQTVSVKLDESSGLSRSDAQGSQNAERSFTARIVYPRQEVLPKKLRYGDTLQLEVQAYETLIVHVEPLEGPVLLGGRYRETKREAGRASYEVFGRAGQKTTLLLAGSPGAAKVLVDGQGVAFSPNEEQAEFPVAFPGREAACRVKGGGLSVETSQAGWRFVGKCTAEVPPGVKATMHLLCDPRRALKSKLECTAEVNGQAVEVRVLRSLDRPIQVHREHAWSWFEFDVPAGRSEVCVAIKPTEHGRELFRGGVGWWLWAEYPLQKRSLTLEFDSPLPVRRSEPLPLPVNMDHQRQVFTIQPPKELRAGNRWWKLDQATVWLDQSAPDEVVQEYGTLATNQSYWGKEMIISGRKFARGLGAHANSRIVYELTGGKFKKFRCLVGRDEHAVNGRVVFQVCVDQKKVFDSGPMDKTTPAKSVDVDISGGKLLELRTLDGGDGIGGDHGNWADAQLVR